jgi:hypothetical protein
MVAVDEISGLFDLPWRGRQYFRKAYGISDRFSAGVGDSNEFRSIPRKNEGAEKVPRAAVCPMIRGYVSVLSIVPDHVGNIIAILLLAYPPCVDVVLAAAQGWSPSVRSPCPAVGE